MGDKCYLITFADTGTILGCVLSLDDVDDCYAIRERVWVDRDWIAYPYEEHRAWKRKARSGHYIKLEEIDILGAE